MTARTGMSTLITQLRALANAGTADVTLGGTVYWSDDALQSALDRYRHTQKRIELEPNPDYTNGAYSYTEYPLPLWLENFERSGSASGWYLGDAAGSAAPTHSINYDARIITFDADTAGLGYFLDCRTYEIERAAADVWEQKAGFVAANVDWQTDNHRIQASQEYEHCLKMAQQFKLRAGVTVSTLVRTDEIGGCYEWD